VTLHATLDGDGGALCTEDAEPLRLILLRLLIMQHIAVAHGPPKRST
jgi:hypothetical protein